MHPALATRLEAADPFTLAQLIERVNGVGRRQGPAHRRLAARAGASIGLGFGAHIEQPSHKLYRHELDAVVAPASDTHPLEKFIVPTELDGRHGLYRRPQAQCLLQARNVYQAASPGCAPSRA